MSNVNLDSALKFWPVAIVICGVIAAGVRVEAQVDSLTSRVGTAERSIYETREKLSSIDERTRNTLDTVREIKRKLDAD